MNNLGNIINEEDILYGSINQLFSWINLIEHRLKEEELRKIYKGNTSNIPIHVMLYADRFTKLYAKQDLVVWKGHQNIPMEEWLKDIKEREALMRQILFRFIEREDAYD